MGNRITRTVLFAASALLSMVAFGAGAARFGTLRNSDWVVTNAWQAVSNKTHDLILEIGQEGSLPPNWQSVSNAAMNAVSKGDFATATNNIYGALSDIKTDSITDGTNTIDAAGNYYTLYPDSWISSDGNIFTNVGYTTAWYSIITIQEDEVKGYIIYEPEENAWLCNPNSSYETPSETYYDIPVTATNLAGGAYVRGDHKVFVGKIALTNDIPPAVTVVAPSTNAVTGQAADAKATGTALYTGFTEWEFSGQLIDTITYTVAYDYDEQVYNLYRSDFPDYPTDVYYSSDPETTTVYFSDVDITATRHLVTPTKTSQLTNDGSNGVPFAVVTQIPSPVDIETKVSTNALAGQTYDFSRNYDIIKATAAIAEALGATVTNNPTAQGGN